MTTFILLVAASVVANMALGSVWYLPQTFGTAWMKDVHLDPKSIKKDAMMRAMTFSAVGYAVMAAILGYARNTVAFPGIQQFLAAALLAWVAFILCVRITHALFEQKKFRYIAITSGHDLVSIVITALIMYHA